MSLLAGLSQQGDSISAHNADPAAHGAHTQAWSTITNTPTTRSGYGITDAQPLDSDLTALAGLSTTGLVARTGTGTSATRTITGTANQITVTNGDGVAGNPTLSLPQDIATTSSPTFAGAAGISMGGLSGVRLSTYKGAAGCIGFGINLYGGGGGYENSIFAGGTSDANGRISFGRRRSDTETYTERMVVDVASGNVGIGTLAPGARLDLGASTGVVQYIYKDGSVNAGLGINLSGGSGELSLFSGATGDGAGRISFGRRRVDTGTYTERMVIDAASGVVKLNSYGAGTLVTDSSGNVTASSDGRLKNVTGSFQRGLADVLKLQPKVYHWNKESGMNTDDLNVGFIAQDVLEVIPEAVGQYRTSEVEVDGEKTKKREKAELLTLSDRPLIAALVNAVKELKSENDELRNRIDKLEAKK